MNITALTGLILLVISMAVVKAGFMCPPERKKNTSIQLKCPVIE